MAAVIQKPANEDVFRMLTWARTQILKYNSFAMTDHFNRRLTDNGRATWSEVRDAIQHGTCCSARPHPQYFVGMIQYKGLAVIIGSNNKGIDKPTLLTFYRSIDTEDGWNQFLAEHDEISWPERVVKPGKMAPAGFSDEDLEAEVVRRRLARKQGLETRVASISAKLGRLHEEVSVLEAERSELEAKLRAL
jgi:hypothetical protein